MPGYLGRDEQEALVEDIRQVVQAAPLYVPTMPGTGKPMSVRMTNCGSARLGAPTGSAATAIRPRIPKPMTPWPPIPERLLHLWREVAGYPHPPEACLVNFYSETAKMGLHQDRDEQDFDAPVVSVSLGDACLFRVGGQQDARAGRFLSGSKAATSSCWVARGGSASTASIASIRRPRRS